MSRGWSGGSTTRWRRIRAYVLQRDRHQCQIRGPKCTGTATTVDHIVPKSAGGEDTTTNLRGACPPCNYGRRHVVEVQPQPQPKRVSKW